MTTRVSLLLPIFDLPLPTNNPEVIASILLEKYGLVPDSISWLDCSSSAHPSPDYHCAISLPSLALNFPSALHLLQTHTQQQQTIARLRADISGLVLKCEGLLAERGKGEKWREAEEEGEISLKVEERRSESTEGQLAQAVCELTRENIRLKDTLSYYEAQMEFAAERPSQIAKK